MSFCFSRLRSSFQICVHFAEFNCFHSSANSRHGVFFHAPALLDILVFFCIVFCFYFTETRRRSSWCLTAPWAGMPPLQASLPWTTCAFSLHTERRTPYSAIYISTYADNVSAYRSCYAKHFEYECGRPLSYHAREKRPRAV